MDIAKYFNNAGIYPRYIGNGRWALTQVIGMNDDGSDCYIVIETNDIGGLEFSTTHKQFSVRKDSEDCWTICKCGEYEWRKE